MARHTNRYGDAKDGASKERVNAEQLSLEAIMQAYHAKKANEKNSLTNKSGKSFKTTETVSAAAIFKNKKGSKCDKKNRKRKEKTPELISNFEEGIEEARSAISENTKTTFQEIQNSLTERIVKIRTNDKAFFDKIAATTQLLAAPLADEKLETRVRKGDVHEVQVVEIGRRVAAFKKLIHKEESRLKGLWNQWDDVQNDYIRLGIEVFGPQAFGDLAAEHPNMQGGYKKDLELLSLEHEANVEALDKEAEEIGATILQEWKNAEKELDSAAKKEQAKLLQALMQD